MKKNIFTMGVVLIMSALALSSCAKDELAAPSARSNAPLTSKIFASITKTRTTNDGFHTLWAAGDKANIFHVMADSTNYVKDGSWTADAAGATSNFTGNINGELDSAALYNWYMCYPNKPNLTAPDGTGATFVVGNRIQKQVEFGSSAHLSGANVPLAGRAIGVPSNEVPAIAMNNLCTALEIKITNNTGNWLRLHTVDFIGPDGSVISGDQYVNFTGAAPQFTPSTTVYGDASVRIDGGAVLLDKASATAYLALAPFTAPAGSQLKMKVNGYEKTLDVTEPIEFGPGHIRTINFDYDAKEADYSGTYFIGHAGDDGKMYIAMNSSVQPAAYDGSTGQNLVLLCKGCRYADNVLYYDEDMSLTASETIDNYKFTITKVTDNPLYNGMYTIKGGDGLYMCSSNANSGNSTEFKSGESELPAEAYYEIAPDGNDGSFYIVAFSASTQKRRFAFNYSNGNFPRMTHFDEGTTSLNAVLLNAEACAVDPLPRLKHTADINLPAGGTEGYPFDVTVENNETLGWELAVLGVDGTVVTEASVFGAEVTLVAAANTDTLESKTGYVVVALLDPTEANNVVDTVKVIVNKKPTKFYKQVTSIPSLVGVSKTNTEYEYILVCKDLKIAFASAAQSANLTKVGNYFNIVMEEDGSIAPTDKIAQNTVRLADNTEKGSGTYISIWCKGIEGSYWWQSVGIKAAGTTASMNYNIDDRFANKASFDADGNFIVECKGNNYTGWLNVNEGKGSDYEFRYNSTADEASYTIHKIQLYQLEK